MTFEAKKYHQTLADYFLIKPLYLDETNNVKPNNRKLVEQPWQLAEAEEWQRLSVLLAEQAFFTIAWDYFHESIKEYWSRIQNADPNLKLEKTYSTILSSPNKYDVSFLWGLASFFQEIGYLNEAMILHQEIITRFENTGKGNLHAGAMGNLAEVLRMQGDTHPAYKMQLEVEKLFRQLKNSKSLAICLVNLAMIDSNCGRNDLAIYRLDEAESLFHDIGYINGEQQCLGNKAEIMRNKGDLDRALQLVKEQEKLAIQLSSKSERARNLGAQAEIFTIKGDFKQALQFLNEAESIFLQVGDQSGLGEVYGGKGRLFWELASEAPMGQDAPYLKEAMRLHREEEKIWRKMNDLSGLSRCLANQARIFGVCRFYDDAIRLCEEAEAFGRQCGDEVVLEIIRSNVAVFHRRRGY